MVKRFERPSVLFVSSAGHPLQRLHDVHVNSNGPGFEFHHTRVDPQRHDLAQFLFNKLLQHEAIVVRDPVISSDLRVLMADLRSLEPKELEGVGFRQLPTVIHLDELKEDSTVDPVLSATFRNLAARFRNERQRVRKTREM